MKTRGLLIIMSVLTWIGESRSGVGTWKNFTSMKEEIRGVTREGSTYWAATSGGMFGWNPANNSYTLFTNAEGLQSTNLTAVAVDAESNIWTGTTSGIIHVYSQRNKTWRYIPDIASTNQTNKKINSFAILGDTILVCTEFGLSVFRLGRFEFGDTYSRFGSLQGSVRVSVSSAVVFNDSLWLCVSDGQNTNRVAVAGLSTPNLLPPESWSLRTVGGSTVAPKQLAAFNNKLYAATNSGLFVYAAGDWNSVALPGQNVLALSSSTTLLGMSTSSQAYTVDSQNNLQQVGGPTPFPVTCMTSDATGQPVLGSLDGGLLSFSTTWDSHAPNGPNSNSFVSVAVNIDGTVWGASGSSNGKGFYRYNGRDWKSFTVQTSGIPTDNFYRVSVGCNGSVWVSSAGRGVIEMPPGSDRVDSSHIYGRNVGMVGLPNFQGDTSFSFIVITSVVCDNTGNHWMGITKASDSRILAVRRPNNTWVTLPARVGSTSITTLLDNAPVERSFAVDGYDNLWAVASRGNLQGVFSLGNRGAIDDSVQYFLTAADGLPSNEVSTIVVDRENSVWVGTDKGIGIIIDPLQPKRSGGIASYIPLRGTVINCIAVDALNQKWVGTPDGVIVLSSDGTQQLAFYTVASTNGRLINNDVKSIAIDGNTGTVYFGTLSGLASLTTVAAAPKTAFDKLLVSPNPFIIPASSDVLVDGLVENSTLKILSIDGRLVRQIRTPGGRIGFWDGKDEEGTFVSSGVYIIIASSDKDEAVARAKVAVIRR